MIKEINIQIVNCVSLFYFSFPLLICQLATVVFFFPELQLKCFHIYRFLSDSNSW